MEFPASYVFRFGDSMLSVPTGCWLSGRNRLSLLTVARLVCRMFRQVVKEQFAGRLPDTTYLSETQAPCKAENRFFFGFFMPPFQERTETGILGYFGQRGLPPTG